MLESLYNGTVATIVNQNIDLREVSFASAV
jgi:hypothetical protein